MSLAHDEYEKHLEQILKIIIKHLNQEAIYSFKHTEHRNVKAIIADAQIMEVRFEEYASFLEAKEEPNPDWEKEFLNALNYYFRKKYDCIPNGETLNKLLFDINETINDAERFLHGDQFTIYIPENFNPDKILNLCIDLDHYLKTNGVRPGGISDVASALGAYLNFRNEFLLQDIQWMNDNCCVDENRKIYAVNLFNDEHEMERRQLVVEEQEDSELYIFLDRYFRPHLYRSQQDHFLFHAAQEQEEEEQPTPANRRRAATI